MKKKFDVAKALRAMVTKHTPLRGNRCKQRKCKGRVIKRVYGLSHGKFFYSIPECDKCGSVYLYANDAQGVGEAEFMEQLHTPMTI